LSGSIPRVFISYSHDSPDHKDRVLSLSERLRQDGLETSLDQYVRGTPRQKWPRWMLDQLDWADFVLVICTETYHRRFRGCEEPGKGKGADWEGALITQEIYDARSTTTKFVPVIFEPAHERFIPEPLRGHTFYLPVSEDGYQALYDFLLDQSGIEPGETGVLKKKPRKQGTPLSFGSPGQRLRFSLLGVSATVRRGCLDVRKTLKASMLLGMIPRPTSSPSSPGAVLGRPSLVVEWMARKAADGWPGFERVFEWTFYSQGTREQGAASAEQFVAEALKSFGAWFKNCEIRVTHAGGVLSL
jgi:SEFIR domain-containing protein